MRRLSTLQQQRERESSGRRKLNQNADKSEDIVILAYFSVFGVEKGCNVTAFSSLLMSFGWRWAFWEFNFCCPRNKGRF